MLIRDIPSIKDLVAQARAFKAFKTLYPILKPLLAFIGVDTTKLGEALSTVDELAQQVEILSRIPDKFDDLFSSRGWIIYDLLNLEVAKKAISLAEGGNIEEAENYLVDHFGPDTVRWQLKTMFSVEAFRPRMGLAEKALTDYEQGRYHACVPVILAQIDGLVSDLHEKQRGFFAQEVELKAWDSLAAHSKGLTQLSAIFNKGRRKTVSDEISIPYRHGIMHGRDLGYDNVIVAAKTWAALFAVRDWAIKAERDMLQAPPKEPDRTWREIFESIAYHTREKERWENWQPRELSMASLPADPEPGDFESRTPEHSLSEYLHLWKASNYGHMADFVPYLFRKYAEIPIAAEVRAAYQDKKLESFRFSTFEHSVPSIAEIGVDCELQIDGERGRATYTFRMICEDANGEMVSHGNPDGRWVIMNWNVV
jgi:hypothetical protein